MTMKKLMIVAASVGLIAVASGAQASGEQVFQQTCAACHTTGAAGAPKVGDKAAWKDRVAKGKDTLYKHALHGFKGDKGFMPPKGGRADLSDDAVKSAVDYMVAQVK
jgi:cytochrome c5